MDEVGAESRVSMGIFGTFMVKGQGKERERRQDIYENIY